VGVAGGLKLIKG